VQLFDGGSTKSIASGEHDIQPARRKLGGKLADRRGLAGAIDADNQDNVRLVRKIEFQRLGHRAKHLLDFRCHDGADFLCADILAVACGAQSTRDADGGFHTQIGLDQHIFEVLQRIFIELAPSEDAANGIPQLLGRPEQSFSQALEPGKTYSLFNNQGLFGLLFLDRPADSYL